MDDVRGALLDIDGTLVDSNGAHARAWVEVFAEAGVFVVYDEIRRLIGMGGDKIVPAIAGIDAESKEGEAILARRGEIFRERHLQAVRAFDGSRALLARMKAQGLMLVVATSAAKEEVEPLLAIAGVSDLIDAYTSGDDVERSKPDPDIVQGAIDRSGLRREALIMVGDTPYDLQAATRAGVRTVALRCGGWDDKSLRGAAGIYDDPADLLARYDTSPFAARTQPTDETSGAALSAKAETSG